MNKHPLTSARELTTDQSNNTRRTKSGELAYRSMDAELPVGTCALD